MRDIRIRSKLGLILIVPLVAVVALASLRLADSGRRALDANVVSALTSLSVKVSALSQALHKERMAAAEFLAEPAKGSAAYSRQTRQTDDATAAYRDSRQRSRSVPATVNDRLNRIDVQLPSVEDVRQEVLTQQRASVSEVIVRYGVIINDLVSYREELDRITSDAQVAATLRAVAAFAKAKAQVEEEQAVGFAALSSGRVEEEQFSSFLATLTGQQEAFIAFTLAATPQQRAVVSAAISGDAVDLADQMATEVRRSVGGPPRVGAQVVSRAIGAIDDLMRWAEQRLDDGLVRDATALRASVLQQVIVESAIVFLALVLAIALASILARSMARSLARLRHGALSVANRDLPEAIARLRDLKQVGDDTPERIANAVRDPIQLDNRDEIGQVADAFNVVHRNAVRIAAEQAVLRTSVAAMFLNLARRSQTLVDRMIGELDDIERGEEDPKRLSRLFKLDNLATRMRRNDENLLVLAGADSSPPRREDAQLIDIVRAAQSEVELYDRIEFGTLDQDVSVAAHAVNDTVRLLAELFDNAIRFSPPESAVVVSGRRIGDYVLIQVEDLGLGMTDEQFAAVNSRLMAPSAVDISAFRMMGIAVVSRLAARYRIRVELHPNTDGGIVANVSLPASILILPEVRGRDSTLGRPRTTLGIEWSRGNTEFPQRIGGPVNGSSVGLQTSLAGARRTMPAPVPSQAASAQPAAAQQPRSGWAPAEERHTPVAGDALGYPSATASPAPAPATDTIELPIFQETEALWFRSHGHSAMDGWEPSMAEPAQASRPSGPSTSGPSTSPGSGPSWRPTVPPAQRVPAAGGGDEAWRTRADLGWRAASAASEPVTAGTTLHGLAKRVPAANLVPGGVEPAASQRTRRSPEDVRGVLSAYHRGVHRGRGGDSASPASIVPQPTEEPNG